MNVGFILRVFDGVSSEVNDRVKPRSLFMAGMVNIQITSCKDDLLTDLRLSCLFLQLSIVPAWTFINDKKLHSVSLENGIEFLQFYLVGGEILLKRSE